MCTHGCDVCLHECDQSVNKVGVCVWSSEAHVAVFAETLRGAVEGTPRGRDKSADVPTPHAAVLEGCAAGPRARRRLC